MQQSCARACGLVRSGSSGARHRGWGTLRCRQSPADATVMLREVNLLPEWIEFKGDPNPENRRYHLHYNDYELKLTYAVDEDGHGRALAAPFWRLDAETLEASPGATAWPFPWPDHARTVEPTIVARRTKREVAEPYPSPKANWPYPPGSAVWVDASDQADDDEHPGVGEIDWTTDTGFWFLDRTGRLSHSDAETFMLAARYDRRRTKGRAVAKASMLTVATSGDDGRATRREIIPDDVKIHIWQRDGGMCTRCSSIRELEFDHIIPLAMGGANIARNLQLLCSACNQEKGANLV